jgi:archaellum component FlaF (FlaF/FlaG flagellin family)
MKLNKKVSSIKILSLAFIILISTPISISAKSTLQDNGNAKVNEMTNKLAKKLLLTKDQEVKVKNILNEYFKGLENISGNGSVEEKVRKIADAKIEDILDNKQIMKFEIIREDWWALTKQ